MNKGLLIVVSGPAGSGKGTVNAELLKTGDFVFSVSATTRAPRANDIDHVTYHFISREEFLRRIENDEMLEYNCYCDNYYGTPRREVEETLAAGKNIILEIDVNGAMHVKEKYPDAILIMLLPPDYATLEARLRGRGTETEDVIRKRLAEAANELACIDKYDYVVYNYENGIAEAAGTILGIVAAEKHRISRTPGVAERFFAKK